MSDQDNGQVSTLQRPTTDDPEAWKAYWKAQGWPWRIEPEIDADRQKYLAERRAIVPDIEQGIYPFKDVKLSRADVEWLLVTHENGRGPVDWSDESQREREGLDLRGADLQEANLSELPLACLHGGLSRKERIWGNRQQRRINRQQRSMANLHLEHTDLFQVHLEGSSLRFVRLEDAHLQGAYLQKVDLTDAHCEGTYLRDAKLDGASLRRATFDANTFMNGISLGNKRIGFVSLLDVRWNGVNIAGINWKQVQVLGDEEIAKQRRIDASQIKDNTRRLFQYEDALRANRQLATVLQSQGLNEDAARFSYRAQKLQRVVLRLQKKFGQYFFSLLLDLLAGYGYRPGRSVIWYLATILVFALASHFLGGLTLYPPDAFVFSIMSFHGRGFFPALSQETNLHNPLVMLAALEAIIGLLIEISFIATFTQRFFGR
jgi:uncharacterized protein YjbI with pentapeptide repeats